MLSRRDFLLQLAGCAAATTTGCGTVLHHERIGRPHSNDIDWKIAALNGLGLALFFVPGVVAFAVDFYNGSIYLPHGPTNRTASGANTRQPSTTANHPADNVACKITINASPPNFDRVACPRQNLTTSHLEAALSERLGYAMSLRPNHTRVSKMTNLDQFASQCEAHRRDACFGFSLSSFCVSES